MSSTPEINSPTRKRLSFADRPTVFICLLLAGITWAVFGKTRNFGFVGMDDNNSVYDNPRITSGLSWKGILWAFTHVDYYFYHPLTSISHMADCQWHGLNAGGHHLTNVLLHIGSAVVLFLALRKMTAAQWPSAFVGALFALHPLHVESVAWVTERKDTLSGLFFMLMLYAYAAYVQRQRAPWRYGVVLTLFLLGLLSKPSLVPVPFLLLVLDYWPLERWRKIPFWKLVLEKLPFLCLSLAASIVAVKAQGPAVQSLETFPVWARVGNAAISYGAYIGQMFYPLGLTIFYPHDGARLDWLKAGMITGFLLATTAAVFLWRKHRPYLLTGWLWYLGMLVPMIGLVQVGKFARADRYTYLSLIGLFIMIAWAAADVCRSYRLSRSVPAFAASLVLLLCGALAYRQTRYWQGNEALWTHAVACEPGGLSHYNLGFTYAQKGESAKAVSEYRKSLQITPDYVQSLNNLSWILSTSPDDTLRDGGAAVNAARQAVTLTQGRDPLTIDTLSAAYAEQGRFPEAIEAVEHALLLTGENPGLSGVLREHLALYKSGKPVRDIPSGK